MPYALLGALAGFRYSAVQQTLWLGPQLKIARTKPFSAPLRAMAPLNPMIGQSAFKYWKEGFI
jgi:hypothetical protein